MKIKNRKAMTPKEKAQDLIVKMLEYTPDFIVKDNKEAFEIAKLHIKIALQEILDIFGGNGVYGFIDPKIIEYWEEVKQEIEKL